MLETGSPPGMSIEVDWDFSGNNRNKNYYTDIFSQNGRISRAEIRSSDGIISHLLHIDDNKYRQSFNNLFLRAGKYKLYIRDVFSGSKWDDTCLGEIVFSQGSELLNNEILQHALWKMQKIELGRDLGL